MSRSLLFVSSSRADWGKVFPLIRAASEAGHVCHVLCTGQHFRDYLGATWIRVEQQCREEGWHFLKAPIVETTSLGSRASAAGERVLAELRSGSYDLVVIHGDRAEALGAAQHASLDNHRVAHVEGGEVSGTADESMRHCITHLSHLHLVSNDSARDRVLQLGERTDSVHVIGSPDLDVALSPELPSVAEMRARYPDVPSDPFGMVCYHPVTTMSPDAQRVAAETLAAGLPDRNWLVLGTNDDPGHEIIAKEFEPLKRRAGVGYLPSMRFEHFLTALRHAKLIVGNSSAGIREAPVYGVPSLDVGTRQHNRGRGVASVLHISGAMPGEIGHAVATMWGKRFPADYTWGDGKSAARFVEVLERADVWSLPIQKQFIQRKGWRRGNPEKVERNEEIYRLRSQGESTLQLAARFGISTRVVREIVARVRSRAA